MNEPIIVNQIITSIIVKTIGKIASAYARIFHYEYNVMSRGFCQKKIFSNPDLVKRSNAAPSTVVDVMDCD